MGNLVTCFGELLVDFFPSEIGVPLEHVPAFLPIPGGAPANVAIALKRLGIQSAFLGKVGDDAFGHALARRLESEGVDTRGLRFDPEVRTTCVFIAQPNVQTQEFLFFRNPGADMMFHREEIAFEILRESRILHFGSVSLAGGPVREALKESVAFCKRQGVFLSFDVNYRPSLWRGKDEARETILEIIPQVDLVKLNEDELFFLTMVDSLWEGIQEIVQEGVPNVVVTLGERGSSFWSGGESGEVAGFTVPVVDTTGCGDSFAAGMLTQIILRGTSSASSIPAPMMSEILRFANACGALTAMRKGVVPALPTYEMVEKFLEEAGGLAHERNIDADKD